MVLQMAKMTESDIKLVVKELERWDRGEKGSKLTWDPLAKKFGFTRQTLQSKGPIKAAYLIAKKSLSEGVVQTKDELEENNTNLTFEVERLQLELQKYKQKEILWMRRWQQIAFHIRQKGIQMSAVDREPSADDDLPSKTEAERIVKLFDKNIPPSGRV